MGNKSLFQKIIGWSVVIIFIGAIILYTYPLIGLWGQIKPVEYPGSYQETNQFLNSQNLTGHIIYLPWEGYLTYTWTLGSSSDGRIAVPINKVVEPIIITSPGLWGGKNDLQQNITYCLTEQSVGCLENQSVQYIMKDKCAFYPTIYPWINETLVYEDNCIQIYKINNKSVIDRSIHVPLRFIIGSSISLITLIGMIIYLILHSERYKKLRKK